MRNKIGIQNYFLMYVILMIVWTLLHINDIFGPSKGMASYIRNYQVVAILLNFLLLTAIHIFEVRINFTYIFVLPIVTHAISSLFTYLFLFVFQIFHLTDLVAFFYLTVTVMTTLVTLKRTLRTFAS
ncbi:hypothetical protein [Flavihumibacter solisilvae]|uniref:Uncharacterized protein n=1 Tax=Flavihumibacter solisilvae TaxID=1349421 RepID=A0A0C1IV10_9BACT|nr:hypothetical protein [Flavihumibacter solisilvae]KIC94349.1 hypothetical protein OI18_12060 [Flavihumibacter solisilvae]